MDGGNESDGSVCVDGGRGEEVNEVKVVGPNGKMRIITMGASGFAVREAGGKEISSMKTDADGNIQIRGNFKSVSEKTEGMRSLDDE